MKKPFDICERTFQFALRIVQFCVKLQQKSTTVHWLLSKQLLRAGTSIGANVEESQAAQSRADFISKASIARKESRETCYWLRLIAAAGISSPSEVSDLISEVEELNKILTSIIKTTRDRNMHS